MSEVERASALQVLQLALCEDTNSPVVVWQLDALSGNKPTCRQWLRKGRCDWGERCKHAHDMTLAEYGLRATRGASMPSITQVDAKAACYGPPGPPIAFILFDSDAIYDFEDPGVAKEFLCLHQSQGTPLSLAERGNNALNRLTSDLVVSMLLDAGAASACRALASCHQWRECSAATQLREDIYERITGLKLPGCTGGELADVVLSSQLLAAVTHKLVSAPCQLKHIVGFAPRCAKSSVVSPGECIALLLDAGTAFCVFRNGDLRCYRLNSGQLLGTSHARRLGKGCSITCACLAAGEVIVLGDTCGGLNLIMRDDLSESKQVRQSGPGAVTSVSPINTKGALVALGSGSLELLTIEQGESRGIRVVCTVQPSSMALAATLLGHGDAYFALLCTTLECVWLYDCGKLDQHAPLAQKCGSDTDIESAEFSHTGSATTVAPGYCSIRVVEQKRGGPLVVTASSMQTSIIWWSLTDSMLYQEEVSKVPVDPGFVTSLSSGVGLVVSCHANCSVLQWHSASKDCVMHIRTKELGFMCIGHIF